MGMTIGRLDRRVSFLRAELFDDGFQTRERWVNHGAPVSAARRDISDAEKAAAGTVLATATARFTVRHTSLTAGLTPRDRLACDGSEWGIDGIKQVPEPRRQWLEITATRRAS